VFSQIYKNYEVIVVNDGSPDTEKLEIVLECYRDRIIYLKQENQGAGPARNAGLKVARGELIAFLDSDDIWLPEFLESQVTFLQEKNFDLVCAGAYLFGIGVRPGSTFIQNYHSETEATFESLINGRCNIITSGTLAKKDAILDVNGFKSYKTAQDFDLWVRMALNGARLGYQKKILLRYRVHTEGLSGNSIQRIMREISAYSRFLETLSLNNRQKQIIESQIKRLEGFLLIERGKSFLLNENFQDAKEEFRAANEYFRSVKLRAVLMMLHFAPQLLVRLFKWRRAGDLPFIATCTRRQNPNSVK
jgi:glycosyltransferase involved in cell wall biosynthesis